jgi:hypothetical protein
MRPPAGTAALDEGSDGDGSRERENGGDADGVEGGQSMQSGARVAHNHGRRAAFASEVVVNHSGTAGRRYELDMRSEDICYKNLTMRITKPAHGMQRLVTFRPPMMPPVNTDLLNNADVPR